MSRISQVLNYALVNMILMGVHLSDPSFTLQYWSVASSGPGLLCMMGPCREGRRAVVGSSVRGVIAGGWVPHMPVWAGSRCGSDPDAYLRLLVCVSSGLGCVWHWSVCCKASGSHSVSGGASFFVVPCLCTGGQVGWGWLFILSCWAVSTHCVLCSRGPRPGDELFPARWGMVFRGKWPWKSQGLCLVFEGRASSWCF